MTARIAADLQRRVSGPVADAPDVLAEVSQDQGRVVHKVPAAVVRAQSVADVVAVARYATAQGIPVSPRAAGHSFGGQALNEGGIVLETLGLNQIHSLADDRSWVEVGAGVRWRDVVAAALSYGVIPPVLTDNHEATVGGTLSAGGVGIATMRHGTQADNCLALEVVTACGEVVWCTPQEQAELYYHALGGLGQFGIITRARLRLRRHRPCVKTYFLLYDDIAALLADQHALVAAERIDYLQNLIVPCFQGYRRSGGGNPRLVQWFYPAHLTVEVDSPDALSDGCILGDLHFYRHVHTESPAFAEFIQRPRVRDAVPAGVACPWIDVILPWSAAAHYITAILSGPSGSVLGHTSIVLWALSTSRVGVPMFRVPKSELAMAVGFYPVVPRNHVPPLLAMLQEASDLGLSMGGTRYLASWIDFDLHRWRQHFGDHWSTLNALKRTYDPSGLLNPGFIQYEPG
jgi:FAD/FMN-containing dehydrogenase